MEGGVGRVTNHPDYYLSDGSVSFLTGGILFKVHRSFFERESQVFRDLFANAALEDPQSGSEARPFMPDVTPEEFAQLLWVWYDGDYSYRRQTKANWIIILRLATRWGFDNIKELAVRELESLALPPGERIFIYNQHGIDGERLLSSYVELCKSPTVPQEADARLMQMETLINILQAREDAQRKAVEMHHESPTSACLEDEVLREILLKQFKKGLSPRSSGTPTGSGDQASDLNGEHAHRTPATSTITVGEPLVPDRRAPTTGRPSHLNNTPQTGGGKESQEKEQGGRVERAGDGDDESKLAKVAHDREKKGKEEQEKAEREKRERARQDKEKAEKEKQETEKARAEMEKAEKAKQDKEKEAREKEQQKPLANPRNKYRGI